MIINSKKLLDIIQKEKDNVKESYGNVFRKDMLIEKYNLDPKALSKAIDELRDYGYIEKWITGDFVLKED